MSNITRLKDIQLSFLRVHPLSDVSFLDALTSFACVRRYAPFLSAFHLAVSSNAVEVRYAVVRLNRVGIKPTFCYCLLKRTNRLLLYHNLGLESGPNFRWQYSSNLSGVSLEFKCIDYLYIINLGVSVILTHNVIIRSHSVEVETASGEAGEILYQMTF